MERLLCPECNAPLRIAVTESYTSPLHWNVLGINYSCGPCKTVNQHVFCTGCPFGESLSDKALNYPRKRED